MLDEGEGAGDEVQQWALLQEDALGPRRHSRRRIPCAPRFQDGDVVELDSVQLFLSSHDRPEMKVSTSYFHRIRYESVPTRNPWGLTIPSCMVAHHALIVVDNHDKLCLPWVKILHTFGADGGSGVIVKNELFFPRKCDLCTGRL